MEAGVLVMVLASPWAIGSAAARFRLALYAGLAGLLALWGARMLLEGRLSWKRCPVALCLAALFLTGVWQLTPLPRELLGRLSPSTRRLYDQVLPERPEILPSGEETAAIPPAGSTISLYPHASRVELTKLLAGLLLFVVVYNNTASAAALWRLALAAVVNGALLSLFALVQFFTSPPDLMYWTQRWPEAAVFGPFICRDHFPFYVNMCVGLGVGLLLAGAGRHRGPVQGGDGKKAWPAFQLDLLHRPAALWVGCALALMLGSVIFSQSRGGVLALVGAAAVCLAVGALRSRRPSGVAALLVPAVLALALLAWFGMAPVWARLATIWQGSAFRETRLQVWANAWLVGKDFPLWGTGYGTYRDVELLYTNTPADYDTISVHAHNEYLEAWAEGGLVRLALTLAAIGLVFRLGYRAVRGGADRPAGGLALGALFGFSTLVIHSFGDFGIHIPAIAVLAAVLCAQLCALGRDEAGPAPGRTGPPGGGVPDGYRVRLGGLAPLAGAVAAASLGLLLVGEGWKENRVRTLRLAASDWGLTRHPDRSQRALMCLDAAARLAPDDARLHMALARAHLDLFEEQPAADQATPVKAASPAGEHLEAALGHLVRARDLCPVIPETHLMLATYRGRLAQADARTTYLARAELLAPGDPDLWYRCGVMEAQDGRVAQACASWRRCLELSDGFLPRVLAQSALLTRDDVLDKLLPDKPALLLAAAAQLYPRLDQAAQRRPCLQRALRLLEDRPDTPGAEDLHLKASIHRSLGHPAEALEAFRAALALQPRQAGWRFEMAQVLFEQGRLGESRRELVLVLAGEPGNAQARELLKTVLESKAKQAVR